MIYGIGTDIVSIKRIEKLYQQYQDALVKKILSPSEIIEWHHSIPNKPAHFLAKRFSAKEALSKALKTGLRYPVSLSNIALVHDDYGCPKFLFAAPLQKWLNNKGIGNIHISLSDEVDHAVTFVVIEYEN